MQSYKNNIELKKMMLTEAKEHRMQGQLVQGTYGRGEDKEWKGCAVACSVHSLNRKLGKNYGTSDHSVYEKELGIPEWLARLEDTIFEGLPAKEAQLWPEKFLKAIPVGVNLDPIKWKFCAYLMNENIKRVLLLKISDDLKKQVVDAIRGVLNLHEEAIRTGKWDAAGSAESATESAARSAAEWAARAAWSAAAESAESAAESAEWAAAEWAAAAAAESAEWAAAEWAAAESAAWSAESAARSAAWSAAAAWSAYKKHATYLLKLLKGAK